MNENTLNQCLAHRNYYKQSILLFVANIFLYTAHFLALCCVVMSKLKLKKKWKVRFLILFEFLNVRSLRISPLSSAAGRDSQWCEGRGWPPGCDPSSPHWVPGNDLSDLCCSMLLIPHGLDPLGQEMGVKRSCVLFIPFLFPLAIKDLPL